MSERTWTLDHSENHIQISNSTGYIVLLVGGACGDIIPPIEDALLMNAGPALLAACEAVRKAELVCWCKDMPPDNVCGGCKAHGMVVAAIAAARGE